MDVPYLPPLRLTEVMEGLSEGLPLVAVLRHDRPHGAGGGGAVRGALPTNGCNNTKGCGHRGKKQNDLFLSRKEPGWFGQSFPGSTAIVTSNFACIFVVCKLGRLFAGTGRSPEMPRSGISNQGV